MAKKIPNLLSPLTRFVFQAQNAPKSVFGDGPRWGSLRRSPRPPSRLGRGYPLPIPLDAFDVWNSAPQFSGPLNTKSWLCQCAGAVTYLESVACYWMLPIAKSLESNIVSKATGNSRFQSQKFPPA